jgi:transcriptional regulator with XRE-family HTH domain
MHLTRAIRELLLERLEEAVLPFRMTHKAGCTEGSWLWAVRTAVGTPVEELARRLGVQQREIYRLEQAERESRITLGSLQRAAEAMDCELTYGLTPKRGTLRAMAAARNAARGDALKKRRNELNERRAAAGKPRRGRDPQLAAIKILVRLAEAAPEDKSAREDGSVHEDGTEHLTELANHHLGWNSRKIAGALMAKALEGELEPVRMLVELAEQKRG